MGSKLVLGYLRDKIEEHMEKWNFNHDNQFGFTKGGKIDYSLYLLQYIANQAYNKQNKYHKNLFYTFIDFSKAYDSVSREMLISTLRKYNINEKIIDKIVDLYTDDETTIRLGECEEKISHQWYKARLCNLHPAIQNDNILYNRRT